MYEYNDAFFRYISLGAFRSAKEVVPIIMEKFPIKSVLDLGCGQGAWLRVWQDFGIRDIAGIDGDYVDTNSLLVDPSHFQHADLSQRISLDRRFDLVQSLEVAEHLPEACSNRFIDNITEHGDLVLFSAAVPGQGGENHVNEKPYEHWRDLFLARGYVLLDIIRPKIKGYRSIEPWYRYNTFMYIHKRRIDSLSKELQSFRIDNTAPIPDVSPLYYRVRKTVFRCFPSATITALAGLKKRLINSLRRLKKLGRE